MFDNIFGQIVSALVVAAVIAGAGWLWRQRRDDADTERIVAFLGQPGYDFRSTHAIASETNLTEERVRKLCSQSDRIRRNQLEDETWTVS